MLFKRIQAYTFKVGLVHLGGMREDDVSMITIDQCPSIVLHWSILYIKCIY